MTDSITGEADHTAYPKLAGGAPSGGHCDLVSAFVLALWEQAGLEVEEERVVPFPKPYQPKRETPEERVARQRLEAEELERLACQEQPEREWWDLPA